MNKYNIFRIDKANMCICKLVSMQICSDIRDKTYISFFFFVQNQFDIYFKRKDICVTFIYLFRGIAFIVRFYITLFVYKITAAVHIK